MARRLVFGDYICSKGHNHSNRSEVEQCNRIREEKSRRIHEKKMTELKEEADRKRNEEENARLINKRKGKEEHRKHKAEMRQLHVREMELHVEMVKAKAMLAKNMQGLVPPRGRLTTGEAFEPSEPSSETLALEWPY